jgi:hypothetical protein
LSTTLCGGEGYAREASAKSEIWKRHVSVLAKGTEGSLAAFQSFLHVGRHVAIEGRHRRLPMKKAATVTGAAHP